MKKKLRLVTALVCLLAAAVMQPVLAAAPYARSEDRLYTLRQSYLVHNRGARSAVNITLTLPAVHREQFSNQEVLLSRWSRTPAKTSRDERGNITAEFLIPRLQAGEKIIITLETLVRNYGVHFDLETTAKVFPRPHSSYLRPEAKVESDHPEITAKAAELTAGLADPVAQARAFFAFVQQSLVYGGPYRNVGALSALRRRSGVCEDYAALFVALCRASGIPARMVFGYGAVLPGDTDFEKHAWAEFFVSSHGWVPVEPTITSPEVPWQFFAALPASYRHLPFSLQPMAWQWRWSGGDVAVSYSSVILQGQQMPLFADVRAGHWAHAVIEELAWRGLVAGYQGYFAPQRPVTRAEFAKLVTLARGLAPEDTASLFSDVRQADWFHPVVTAAARAGLLVGFPDGTFRPREPVTREQAAAILARVLALDGRTAAGAFLTFIDTHAISAWALPAVGIAVNNRFFAGDERNRFRPRDNTTRAEAAALIMRYLTRR
ncbi:MAG: Endo-1,4-beta-xylanase A [Syntrophomonadaceae bacterium]|nr:Endo-1,4-beta-xylanase A [Bacillota bacterium]